MPRRRHSGTRRRLDASTGAEAWAEVFETGFAMFDDFTDLTGVPLAESGHAPEIEESEAAWRQYGATFLATRSAVDRHGEPIWAVRQFGEPQHASA